MQRACLSYDEVVTVVENLYGLTVTHLTLLNSYDDVNVHVYVKDTTSNPNISEVSSDGYVLKILNSLDSTKVKFVDAMHAAVMRCYDAGIPTPRPIQNKRGEYFTLEELPYSKLPEDIQTARNDAGGRQKFLVRLFEYLPGEILKGKPCTLQLCFSVGQTAAKVDEALMGFYHSGYDGHTRHWCLSRVEFLLDKVDAVDNEQDRDLIRDVVSAFKSHVVANYHKLQTGVIHGDLNDQNLLVSPDDSQHIIIKQAGKQNTLIKTVDDLFQPHSSPKDHQNKVYYVQGVLDFGDSVYRYPVFDIAIAIMYLMVQNDSLDVVDVGGITLVGYLSELELPSFDLSILKECVCGRFAQSLVYGAYGYKMEPSNTYFLQTAAKGWPLLRKLWYIPKKQLYEKWQAWLNKFNIDIKLDYAN